MEKEFAVLGTGTVIPPEANPKQDLGDLPLEVKIEDVNANEGDDCVFVVCRYPDGYVKRHQVFLPITSNEIQHQITLLFYQKYNKHVLAQAACDVANLVGSTVRFMEE